MMGMMVGLQADLVGPALVLGIAASGLYGLLAPAAATTRRGARVS
jgi:hypothetical protein